MGQGKQWCLHIIGRQRVTGTNHLIDTLCSTKDGDKRRRTFENYMRPPFLYRRRKTDKLKGIAEPLFGMKQDRLPGQRGTVPCWSLVPLDGEIRNA